MKKLFAIASVVTLFSIVACDTKREDAYDQRREDSVVAVRTDNIRMHIVDSMNAVCQSYMVYMQDSLRMAYETSARPRTGTTTRPATTTQPTTTQPQQPATSPRPGATKRDN
jgi:hypothetical protein